MMKENSPICARLIPARTEVLVLNPARNAPMETKVVLPMTTSTVNTSTASQFSSTNSGSMSMPTDTKKMAANKSRTGSTRWSTLFSCPDSATSDPAKKAPSATEYPKVSARSAEAKQMPTLVTSVSSGESSLTT